MTPESAAVAAKPQIRMVMISAAVWVMASCRLSLVERDRRRDQAHVGEGLGEVAHGLAARPFDLLAEEPDVVRIAAQPLEAVARALALAGVGQVLDRPEAARREGILPSVHAIVGVLGPVALDEAVLHEGGSD